MAIQFTSSSDQVPLIICGVDPSSTDIDDFWDGSATLMVWAYLDSYGEGTFTRICGKENDTGSTGWNVFTTSTDGHWAFVHSFSTGRRQWNSPDDSLQLNTLYHIAIVWDGVATDPEFYIDGVSVAAVEVAFGSGTIATDASHPLYIGNRGDLTRSFDGTLEDLRLYQVELTAEEVLTEFTLKGRIGTLRGLLRRWPLGPYVPGRAANTPYTGQAQVIDGAAGNVDVPVPSEHIDGDLLVMVAFAAGQEITAPTFTEPSGWTSRQYLSVDTSFSSPAFEIFTRTASSEPASYNLVVSETGTIIAFMYTLPGVANSVDTVTTATGTSSTPSTPTATPTVNCAVLRVMAFDDAADIPARERDVFPGNLKALSSAVLDVDATNGGGVCVAFETWDATATGARGWTLTASEEWGGITICFPFGDGQEGLPLKDLSNAQAHAISYGHMVAGTSELVIRG